MRNSEDQEYRSIVVWNTGAFTIDEVKLSRTCNGVTDVVKRGVNMDYGRLAVFYVTLLDANFNRCTDWKIETKIVAGERESAALEESAFPLVVEIAGTSLNVRFRRHSNDPNGEVHCAITR